MKKIASVVIIISFLFFTGTSVFARRTNYRTYQVIEVTKTTVTLQRHKVILRGIPLKETYGERVTLIIKKPKDRNLKVGDKVRYNKRYKKFGRTLPFKKITPSKSKY